jgi:EAL domain-containing protein (putative c-di-GMP-specific phosphodiesterase class I)
VTASIGIAPVDAVEGGGQAALAAADGAMYEAKEDGRNRVAGYQAQQRDDAHARLTTVERLRTALEHDALALERQVVRDLRTGQDAFYELLVRLPAPDGAGLLPPSSFLPIAERTGLITQIDRWVIGRAVTLLTGRAHERTSLSVNLSGRSLADPGLPEFVAESLARAGADPSRLLFELTETAAIGNMDSAATLAAELRALGCRFALDDFGAGFGSFYYLKHLPLDVVKLDGDFIRDLARSPEDQLVVQAMVEIAHGLGLRTVAEYVGDAETEDLLREYGVDCAQGFFIGRPEALPPE